MKILVLGSGGREHAIVWKLRKDGHQVVCAPGNAGICRIAECVALNPEDIAAAKDFVQRTGFDLTVVGPEAPLVAGIADEFRGAGLPIFGPGREGAQLEGSKAFSKALMQEAGIPTARFETFADVGKAKSYLAGQNYPLVVKASGLALGKGAVIVHSRQEAEALVEEMMVSRVMGEAGATVVIEEFLTGEEASIIGITDGRRVVYLAPSQDHKALSDGDQGPNTGGMGAYAPAPIVTPELQVEVEKQVFVPLLEGLRRHGIEYRGVIYAGIMVTDKGPYVLEFNCRFGDPETQVILPLLSADLGELLLDAATGKLQIKEQRAKSKEQRHALCVVAASAGYPGKYEKGKVIQLPPTAEEGVVVFHAGTKTQDGAVVTSGGRVLGVTGLGPTLPEAKKKAYDALNGIHFEGMQYRRDIGDKGIRRSQKSEIRSQKTRSGQVAKWSSEKHLVTGPLGHWVTTPMKHIVVRGELKGVHRSEAIAALKDGGTVLLPCGGNYLLVSLREAKLQPFGYSSRQRLVRDRKELEMLWDAPSPALVKLADAFMPGSLTLVVNTLPGRAGLMMPDSSFLTGIWDQLDEPLYFQEVLDCDSGSDLQDAYAERVDLWLDVGGVHLVPTTLVDVTQEPPLVQRKGVIPILDIEHVLDAKVKLGPAVVFSVLLVCTGNTCRSAMARGILEQRLRDQRVVIYSAGTNTVPGLTATEGARLTAEALGIDLSRHFSTPLNASQIRDADLILGMEPRHKRRVVELAPEAASRTFVLTDFSAKPGLDEIYDPMGSSLEVFREVAKIIAECLEKVAQDIEERIVAK